MNLGMMKSGYVLMQEVFFHKLFQILSFDYFTELDFSLAKIILNR